MDFAKPFCWFGDAGTFDRGAGVGLLLEETLEVEPLSRIFPEDLESKSLVLFMFSEARRGIDAMEEFKGLEVNFWTCSPSACSKLTLECEAPSRDCLLP